MAPQLNRFLKAVIAVPLSVSAWTQVQYDKIPANNIHNVDSNLEIVVDQSSSPLVQRLEKTTFVSQIKVSLSVQGEIKNKDATFPEDLYLRIGLVQPGEKTLSGPKKWFAPQWIKTLFELAPKNTGISRIFFLGVANQENLMDQERDHPKSDLMHEKIIAIHTPKKPIQRIDYKFQTLQPTIALWLAADGDDTKSKFKLTLQSLELIDQN